MTLANGRTYLAIPGPSVVPDRVLQAMQRPAPNIYSADLTQLTASLIPDLKAVARTKHNATIFIANGHGVWEASLSNTLSRGDRILILATGRFCLGWGAMAERMGVETEIIDFGKRAPIDPARVAEALRADSAHSFKAVLAVHVDTSTSIKNDISALRAAMDETGHPALLMVDCIASLGCDRFEMDDWGVDVMITGSQKGLMTPPGAGFVFYNDKADRARENADLVTGYWDWRPRTDPDYVYEYFNGTAPTHQLFALREALTMLVHEEGVEAAWARHASLASAIWAAFERWGEGGPMELNVAEPSRRSHAVTAARIGAPHGTALREWTEKNAGITLGIGLGMAEPDDPAWHGFFRIGHMGHVNAQMVMGALGSIEAALTALQIPHGQSALDAAAQVLARG